MARTSHILSISLPPNLSKAVDVLSEKTEQTRSELIRSALREYLLDSTEDTQRFLDAYTATRKEKTTTLAQMRKRYKIV